MSLSLFFIYSPCLSLFFIYSPCLSLFFIYSPCLSLCLSLVGALLTEVISAEVVYAQCWGGIIAADVTLTRHVISVETTVWCVYVREWHTHTFPRSTLRVAHRTAVGPGPLNAREMKGIGCRKLGPLTRFAVTLYSIVCIQQTVPDRSWHLNRI